VGPMAGLTPINRKMCGHGTKRLSLLTMRIFVLGGLITFWPARPAAAQSGSDLVRGPLDVFYNQSVLLGTIGMEWPPLKTETHPLPGIDYDIPRKTTLDLPRGSERESRSSAAVSLVQPVEQAGPDTKVHWMPAIRESLYYTGIMHTFDIVTEAGTRDALNGHWFQHYTRSVSELRGWSDSDTFMAPYAGHPIEGSIFGFILRQNDPRYRTVQLGDGRDYYISLLRSMAYSAMWHTQWKIGPASEASIGNVMLHASPGFITLVDTPTLGAVTMFAEDAADRYLIMGLENRTDNRILIVLARCFLNPGRTFAYMMAFQAPWNRDTRLGLFGQNREVRKQLVRDYKEGLGPKPFEFERRSAWEKGVEFQHVYPKEAPIELAAFPVYESFLGGGSCIGGGGSGAARVSPILQVVVEVNGCVVMHMPQFNQSGDSLFYGGGARWTPRASKKLSPYAEFLFGGRKVTHETDDGELRQKLMDEWNDGNGTRGHYPNRSDWSVEVSHNGPSIAVGGGVDVVMTRAFTWRLLGVQYTHTWMGDVDMIHAQDGMKVTTQAVLRIGTW